MNRSVLRGLGVALIALPEPVTTPFGVALLAASCLVPRRSGDSRPRVQAVVRAYLSTYRPYGLGAAFVATNEPGKRLLATDRTGLFYLRDKQPRRLPPPAASARRPVRHHRLSDVLSPVQRGLGGTLSRFEGYWGHQQTIRPNTGVVQHTMRWAAVAAN